MFIYLKIYSPCHTRIKNVQFTIAHTKNDLYMLEVLLGVARGEKGVLHEVGTRFTTVKKTLINFQKAGVLSLNIKLIYAFMTLNNEGGQCRLYACVTGDAERGKMERKP